MQTIQPQKKNSENDYTSARSFKQIHFCMLKLNNGGKICSPGYVLKRLLFLTKIWLHHYLSPLLPLQYMTNVDSWCKACGEVELPSELQDLEDAIHHHQGLYEHITAAYSEVT